MQVNKISKDEANILKKRATYASLTLAISLTLLKTFASFYTGSLAILSSMVDSLSDLFGSFVAFMAVKFSARPANTEYHYGYGKAEPLSALFQSAFIAGSGIFIMYDGINRLLHSHKIQQTTTGIIVMIISLLLTIVLISYQNYVIRKTKSQAIKADSLHYVIDILTNISIIASLVIVEMFNAPWFDILTAFGIAFYILISAYKLAKKAIVTLMDKELEHDIRKDIKTIVLKHPYAKGIHDLRTRDLGTYSIFEFHLELDGRLSLKDAHGYTHEIEDSILKKYPDSQIIIHQEPAGINDDRLDKKLVRQKRT